MIFFGGFEEMPYSVCCKVFLLNTEGVLIFVFNKENLAKICV